MDNKPEVDPIKASQRLNDHGAACKSHANFMLDSDLSSPDDRKAISAAISNYIDKE